MANDEILRRLRAWHAGKPLPRYSTIHVPIAGPGDALLLAFVRMGGESAPWGVAVGRRGSKPTVLTVPEARNRDLVADMAAELAPMLLQHFRHPGHSSDAVFEPDHGLPLRQLWVPNATHLDMLHALAYAYTFSRWGAAARVKQLNALGRLAGWLFREAQRPGEVTVMCATEALTRSYTFPSDGVRQAHLGFLLAWMETGGRREARLAAAMQAERRSISTSLDPLLERDELEPRVDRWNDAHKAGETGRATREAAAIQRILRDELVRRFELTERAISIIENDPRRYNLGLASLERESRREHWYQYLRLEHRQDDAQDGPAFTPSPETDRHPPAAAARYYVHAASEEFHLSALLHDDEELQTEVIAAGDAVRGKITDVRDEGTGYGKVPVWTVAISGDTPIRIREGSDLCVAGLPSRVVQVRSIDQQSDGLIELVVEVTKLKTTPRGDVSGVLVATDPRLRNSSITLLPTSKDGISRLKSQRVWEREAPGAWLTHAAPVGAAAVLPEEVREDLQPPSGGEAAA